MTATDNPTSTPPAKVPNSKLALASFILAISPLFSLLLLFVCYEFGIGETLLRPFTTIAIAAFLSSPVIAAIAIVVIYRSRGRLRGYELAVVAMILAALNIIIFFCSGGPRSNGMALERKANRNTLGAALKRYEHDHGRLPPLLSSLVPQYISVNDAGVLFGPTNHSYCVKSEYRRRVKSIEDARYADEHGPYVYLGYTNHSSGIVMFERPTAWLSDEIGSWTRGQVWALRRDFSELFVPEKLLQDWGIMPSAP